jgi:hypothetical protein
MTMTIRAYNAGFARGIVLGDIWQAWKRPMHLEPRGFWFDAVGHYAGRGP